MLYYVSEVDMLKAIHMALYNEVIKNDNIKDRHFTNLYNFVKLLSEVSVFFLIKKISLLKKKIINKFFLRIFQFQVH